MKLYCARNIKSDQKGYRRVPEIKATQKNSIKKSLYGFSLIELIVVVAVIGVLVAIAIPVYTSNTEAAKIATDQVNLDILNSVTGMYKFSSAIVNVDIFQGINNDEERMQRLVEAGFIADVLKPIQDEGDFSWDIGMQIWKLEVQGISTPLSPLGSTFTEISTNMIALMQKKYTDTGAYGRSWGDYKYTDLGLNPEDWQDPVGHIVYKPSGKDLLITPEHGYTFLVNDYNGNLQIMPSTYNWNLVYNANTQYWYYHSINEENLIDIATLKIEPSN